VLLLDTHVWIRWQNHPSGKFALPAPLVEHIETAESLAISAISCWELGQLVKRGRIELPMPLPQWIGLALEPDIQVLPVQADIALKAALLPEHHRDPADRIIIATSLIHRARLASLDAIFPRYRELEGCLLA
jgi:PIN domain nuclease of toxin-antitoxin system